MPLPLGNLFNLGFGTELIYSFVIIVCSLMIYFGTKDLYELSSYKGIEYFRKAFLFFGIAFFFRSFIKFLIVFFNVDMLSFSPRLIGFGTIVLFMYASTMALFYLLYSVMWKKWKDGSKIIYLFHLIAVVFSVISIVSRRMEMLLGLHIFLFILILLPMYTAFKNSKKKESHIYWIYVLLFAFWILNIIEVRIPEFLQLFKLITYLASVGLFLVILYKVLKKTGSG